MGLTPRENLEFGFHVKDPDGANVQITGISQRMRARLAEAMLPVWHLIAFAAHDRAPILHSRTEAVATDLSHREATSLTDGAMIEALLRRHSMIAVLGWMLFGLIVGVIAKLVMPGRDPGGIFVTMLIGIVGAVLGGIHWTRDWVVSAGRARWVRRRDPGGDPAAVHIPQGLSTGIEGPADRTAEESAPVPLFVQVARSCQLARSRVYFRFFCTRAVDGGTCPLRRM